MASGDITTRAGAQAVLEQTGASAVMIARGAQGDPWLLPSSSTASAASRATPSSSAELVRFVREVAREMTPERAVGWLRKFYGWYLRGGRLGPGMRSALAQAKTIDEVERLLLEACPAAQSLVDQGELDIAALGDDRGRRAARPADLDLLGRPDPSGARRRAGVPRG